MNGPVRVVHIGDSHVRGHVYPLVTRRCLESDFGAEAVYPDSITYVRVDWRMRRASQDLFII